LESKGLKRKFENWHYPVLIALSELRGEVLIFYRRG